jgi:hypothetical protein
MLQKIEVQRSGGFHGHLMVWLDMPSVLSRIGEVRDEQDAIVECFDDLLSSNDGCRKFERYLEKIISGDIPKDPNGLSALNMESYMETGIKRRSRENDIGKILLYCCEWCSCRFINILQLFVKKMPKNAFQKPFKRKRCTDAVLDRVLMRQSPFVLPVLSLIAATSSLDIRVIIAAQLVSFTEEEHAAFGSLEICVYIPLSN